MKCDRYHLLSHRGAALMTILWVIAILSIMVFSATQFLFVDLSAEGNANGQYQAELLAERGIAIAAHPDVELGDPILVQEISEMESFEARVSTEGARLNINTLLGNPVADRIVLEELFIRWGLRFDEAASVVDNLIDWIDEDSSNTGSGAEQRFYALRELENRPFNRAFASLEEVELVNEFWRVAEVKPDWKESFTILSSGPLDLNEAPIELIMAACECGELAAETLVDIREELQNDSEPRKFESVEEALSLLNVPSSSEERIAARVSIDDPVKRIVSIGRFGSITVETEATIQYGNGSGAILQWTSRREE